MQLVALTADELDDVLADVLAGASTVAGVTIPPSWPHAHPAEVSIVRHFAEGPRADASLFAWTFRLMADRETAVMQGHCGFHDPPQAGLLELG